MEADFNDLISLRAHASPHAWPADLNTAHTKLFNTLIVFLDAFPLSDVSPSPTTSFLLSPPSRILAAVRGPDLANWV